MKLFKFCCVLLSLFLLGGCDKAVEEVAVKPAAEAAAAATDYFLIDVRSQKEWDEGHLDDSIHIPHTDIGEGIAKITDDMNAKIYVY